MSSAPWRKSSFSAQEYNCVETAFGTGVRDSKNLRAGYLTLDLVGYQGLLEFAKGLPGSGGPRCLLHGSAVGLLW